MRGLVSTLLVALLTWALIAALAADRLPIEERQGYAPCSCQLDGDS